MCITLCGYVKNPIYVNIKEYDFKMQFDFFELSLRNITRMCFALRNINVVTQFPFSTKEVKKSKKSRVLGSSWDSKRLPNFYF